MEQIFSIAANQGFGVLLLVVAIYYFYKRQQDWEKKIDTLNQTRELERKEWEGKMESIREKGTDERVQLIQLTEELKLVINQNTQTLNAIREVLNEKNITKRA